MSFFARLGYKVRGRNKDLSDLRKAGAIPECGFDELHFKLTERK
jgi:hypothetical protein